MKQISAIALAITLLVSACADTKVINGVEYGTYGLINRDEVKNQNIQNIQYNMSTGNFIWGILLCESIVFPIYFFGFSLYEPVGLKDHAIKGQVR